MNPSRGAVFAPSVRTGTGAPSGANTHVLALHCGGHEKVSSKEISATPGANWLVGDGGGCGALRCHHPPWVGERETMIENFWANAIFSVTPTILMGLLFWFILRGILRADRTERDSYARIEREERIKRGLPVED